MKKLLSLLALGLAAALSAFAAQAADKVLYFYNWSEYLPEAVLDQFTAETGIKVVYTTYDSNEAMYAKLKVLQGGGYDLVVPSTYYVSKMSKEGLIQPIDKTKLGNFKNLDPRLLNQPYDPDNRYSVPYLWGSTGVGVNAKDVDPATVTSWADLWRPEFRGKIVLLNDLREVFYLGLKVLGYSGNDTDPAHIAQAYDKLTSLIPGVRVFNADSPKEPFLSGEVVIGQIWNGEAYLGREELPELTYIYPKEGAALWMDNLVIPAKAEHVAEAHQLIDFLLRPEIAKVISEEIGYATPNKAALPLLDAAVRDDRTVYPNDDDLKNSEFQVDVGEAITVYEQYWEKLKIGQ